MAKRKNDINLNYDWSEYQKDVFNFIESGTGHLVVEANAGCAKTTTMIKCLDYIPEDKTILLSAFNRDIVKELEKKTKNHGNVQVKTLHGLGLTMLKRNFPKSELVPDVYKYDTHIKNYINVYTSINTMALRNGEYQKYLDNIKKYVEFGRFYMCQTEKDLDFIEERYSIDTIADEKEVAIKVMAWGKTELDTVDFTDMVWLPHVLYIKPCGLQFDFIFIDECQDMNIAERELVFKCFKMGTRMISVGDENQCQPAGTKVLLTDGTEKNIEELKVGDYVVTYNTEWGKYSGYKNRKTDGKLTNRRANKILAIENHVENELITIKTETGKQSTYTPGHICYARLNKKYVENAYCTYIMRNKDGMYRIGKTKLRRNGYHFSLNHRMLCEGCCDAWILNIFDTEKEARVDELVNSYKFGIPQLVFDMERACHSKARKSYFLNEEIKTIYNKIGENIEERVKKCLEFNHRKIEYPLVSSNKKNYISSDHFITINACNLFQKYMEVNTFDENNYQIKEGSKKYLRTPEEIMCVDYENKETIVYSLEVENLHNYVADGILTHNCLYSFAGADPNSFSTLKSMPNTTCLPLSISYRCPKNVVQFARKIVPQIEWNPNNEIEGEIKYGVQLDEIGEGDMVLCRNNAPLIHAYNEFLKAGKKATIRGKEFGSSLKTTIKAYKTDKLGLNLDTDGLFVRLYDNLFTTRDKLMRQHGIDKDGAMKSPVIENKLDVIKTLEVLSEGLKTKEELLEKVEEVFPKKSKDGGISLSTVHKAKGLEANNVYIICQSLMPSKSAKKDWEIQQEYNLMYVAYTRAKKSLSFVDEAGFESFNNQSVKQDKILERIEAKVNTVLGKKPKVILNETTARTIIQNASNIRLPQPKARSVKTIDDRKETTFSSMLSRKKSKKKK